MINSRNVHRSILSLTITTLLLLATAPSWAQQQSASRSTFLTLMKVQEMWEEEAFEEALAELEALDQKTADDTYDNALTNQYMAQTAILVDKPELARSALEKALGLPDLPVQLVANLKLFYGQVVLADEEWELARVNLMDWLATTEEQPSPPQLFSTAYANFMTGNHSEAEPLMARAINEARDPSDAWHRLHYEILFELKRFDEAEAKLHGLLASKPNDEGYWRLLANHHLRLENSQEALSALTIAYQQDLLDTPTDLTQIVSLYGYVETPERAARMLETLLEDEVVETEFQRLRHLGNLWLLARERGKAIDVLEAAAELAEDGETDELLASLYFEDEEWALSHDRFLRALEKGGIDETDRISLLAGISAFRAGMKEEARTALREAEKSDDLQSQARSILRQLDQS